MIYIPDSSSSSDDSSSKLPARKLAKRLETSNSEMEPMRPAKRTRLETIEPIKQAIRSHTSRGSSSSESEPSSIATNGGTPKPPESVIPTSIVSSSFVDDFAASLMQDSD